MKNCGKSGASGGGGGLRGEGIHSSEQQALNQSRNPTTGVLFKKYEAEGDLPHPIHMTTQKNPQNGRNPERNGKGGLGRGEKRKKGEPRGAASARGQHKGQGET